MRYYYDDPLAAAWMHDKFGMTFCDINGNEVNITDGIYFTNNNWDGIEKAYVSPDSLHILDLHYGDLTLDDDPIDNGYRWLDVSKAAYLRKNFTKIIQRNGIPFMMPKEEV